MATRSGAAQPRRWPRRLLLGLNIFIAVCLVVTGSAYLYLKYQLGRVPRIDFACDVLRNCGNDDPGAPMNVLLVGSDSRKDVSPAERRKFGTTTDVGGERSDTIIVLHVDPRAQKAAILSIPRDLAVPIAGSPSTTPRRINSAFESGPDVLIKTIDQSLGIGIDHYAQVDFNGFRGLVGSLGGVTLYFAAPVRDRVSGLDIPRAGCVELTGDEALAFVRSRNYQYLEGGRWRVDPTADLGRIERQQDFIQRVLRKASRVGRNPFTLNALVNNAVKNVKIDDALSTKDILRLARRFKSFEPDAVEMFSLPTTQAREAGAAVLKLKQPDAAEIINRFKGLPAPGAGQAPPPPPKVVPGTVRVRVLNGSGTDGQAGTAARGLRDANFGIAGIGSAEKFGYASSVIRYAPGQLPKAQVLAAYVDGETQLQETPGLGGDLVLVTGATFRGVREASAPPTPAPATTAPARGQVPTTTKPAAKAPPAEPQC